MKPLLIVVALCAFAMPQTAQAPKLKEYPTRKACESTANPEWQFDCYRLKDGKWAIVTDSTKPIPKSKSILEIGTGHPPTPGYIELPLAMALVSEPQMMVPTMHDKVMHLRELGCEKGYEEGKLVVVDPVRGEITEVVQADYLDVCVKPSFIAQLRKAEQ